MSTFDEQFSRMKNDQGFIAALDQSGGSTPKALKAYGVEEGAHEGEEEMYKTVHAMRTRIVTNAAFTGERILGAILFENTLDREIEGKSSAAYLWEEKRVVPFLKIDKGLAEEENGVQILKPMPDLATLLEKAKAQPVFGTKMRSLIHQANESGVEAVVAQQFDVAREIMAAGLVPIIEPEVSIVCPDKAAAETMLKASVMKHLDTLDENEHVMLKLTLPEEVNLYTECIEHPQVVRVVALSGGYSREEANQRLSENNGMIASFSRALSEGLSHDQSDEEFTTTIDATIESIYQASLT